MNTFKEKIQDWSIEQTKGTQAKLWLGLLSFSEASFFIIPPDILLIAILATGAQRWLYYASFATIFSVLGGLFGYIVGYLFFDIIGAYLINLYHLQEQMLIIGEKFGDNAFLTIFLSAFTPIPYKLFTISAGFFKINIFSFITASIFGRGMRFFWVSFFMKKFGKQTVNYIVKYFDIVSLIIVIILVVWFLFF